MTSVLLLPNVPAQDYNQWGLPEDAERHLGKGYINEIAFSPDGTRLAVASSIGVWIYDVCTGQEQELYPLSSQPGLSVCYSPDGKTLTVGIWDYTVYLLDTHAGQGRYLKGHRHWVHSVCYSPDGKILASGSFDGTMRLWDTHTGQPLRVFKGHRHWVHSVCYSPDGKILASGSSDNTVRLWDTHTGQPLRNLIGHEDIVWSMCYSPDGKTLASGSFDGTVRLWDTCTGQQLRTFIGHTHQVYSVCYSPDGKTLASGSSDGTILLRDIPQIVSSDPQPSLAREQKTPQQIAEDALAVTVLIVMEDAGGQALSTGSGFFVDRGMVATNLHVIERAPRGYVKRVGMDKTFRIQGILAKDSRQDLVIIRVPDVGVPVLPIGKSDKVQIGQSVYVSGNPIGFLEGTFSNGIVSGVREFQMGRERIQITAPISGGNSGGPVLNSKGEVIGVAASIITTGQNLNFAIPSKYLTKLLNEVSGK